MTLLTPSPVSTNLFMYHAASRTFTAEASDLPDAERVYDDACDTGYTLVSARTGVGVVCVVTHIAESEGDILFWTLRPVDPAHRFVVNVFND